MDPTFTQMARCFAAYQHLDSAFWPFVHHMQAGDEVHNDPIASAEAMRRMLAITMADVYKMVMTDTHCSDAPLVEQMRAAELWRVEFLQKAQVYSDLQIT